jgi:hypothetical protein
VRHARVAAASATFLLAAPAAAHAATLGVDAGCYTSGDTITVAGSGFTPNSTVRLAGPAHVTVMADAAGAFSGVALHAPRVQSARPRELELKANSTVDPSIRATVRFPVARALFWSNAPLSGSPAAVVTWRFAGFAQDKPIYGHLRRAGHGVTTRRFGIARGACGVLSVRAKRVALRRPRPGSWELKLDQSRVYAPTTPGRIIRFVIASGS